MPAARPARQPRTGVASAIAGRFVSWATLVALFAFGPLGALAPLAWGGSAGEVREASESESKEFRVKAAMLLKFARYATWPEESFGDAKAPIVVLVVGEDPFGDVLDDTLAGQKLKGRAFQVKRSKTVPPQITEHVVFSGLVDEELQHLLIARCARRPVLLVGDDPGFAGRGALMNFAVVGTLIRFEINADTLEASPLSISSELLKLARIVRTEKREKSGSPRGRDREREEAER